MGHWIVSGFDSAFFGGRFEKRPKEESALEYSGFLKQNRG
jgi:hypothetical protein